MKIKITNLLLLLIISVNFSYSQQVSELSLKNTLKKLNNVISSNQIYYDAWESWAKNSWNSNDKTRRIKNVSIDKNNIIFQNPIGICTQLLFFNEANIKFTPNLTNKEITISGLYRESIGVLHVENKETKYFDSFVLNFGSETALQQFNALIVHLQNLLMHDKKRGHVVTTETKVSRKKEVVKKEVVKLLISSVNFIDQNNNNRIDNNENTSLKITIINKGDNLSNIYLKCKEKNNIQGISFEESTYVGDISSNQTKDILLSIQGNSDIQIGEADFVLYIIKDKKEVEKKKVKISTFNSGPEEFLISKLPDIDINIPKNNIVRKNTYAIIIGNEDYKSKQPSLSYEANVKYAVNDAKIFQEYLINTIGIPNTNITYLTNATSAQIKQAINKVKQLPLVNSNAEIIFYYAGHGLPDEKTKEQYLIPVDVNSSNLSFGLKINEIESELSSNNPKQVLLILDACFSGAARNESLLSNRAVRVRPKENVIKGNSIILSASSKEEASKSYDEMQHGMFTYFLLKKIQETKGNVDLQTLFDFLHFNVREKSLLINNQFQTPTIVKSDKIQMKLNEIKF